MIMLVRLYKYEIPFVTSSNDSARVIFAEQRHCYTYPGRELNQSDLRGNENNMTWA